MMMMVHTGPDIDAEFAALVDELTRRGFLRGGIGSAALLGLGGCADTSDPQAPVATTRQVGTAQGIVTVPVDPHRVVTINAYAYKTMLDLNMTPIMGLAGQVAEGFQIPEYLDRMAEVPSPLNSDGGDNLEEIARLNPDLIISFTADKSVAQLKELAPTATQDPARAWQELSAETADVVNRSDEFEKMKSAYQSRLGDIAEKYADQLQGNRWYVVAPGNDHDWSLWLPDVAVGVTLTELGATFGPLAAGKTGQYQVYSAELLGQLDQGDVILVVDAGLEPSAEATELFKTPGWDRLSAVRAGRIYRSGLFSVASYGEANALLDLLRTICIDLGGAR